MCLGRERVKTSTVHKVHNSDGVYDPQEPNQNFGVDLPEHADNALLNTNVQTGILGFRYETKNSSLLVYSSIETKTFCYIMQLTPLKK